ncbi:MULTISPECIES: long-chain-fatty-acid--CoA ligase [Geobacillus]|uniref:Long-chain-fatty-acid--CoA ligase n=1 Tax=Geobacillus thermocatenulatus TaxID=33938 RepID=A0A226Q2G9_9BACL|nr:MULTISPECIES: long-chain fatty acid--CoA ligase [Geobacillus]AST00112.1 long-chain fatty acid--CoA ligase [Geobacillus thermocatenulatus]KLR72394.1 AMP-dependent synthetase [Geobacillus sp. T6]OXB86493.1 long-chain-fatty-acid--CoA ligase [Geobacillus thermocatenulatus]RAN29840.1 AMP-dependent synthetase [Geobacillus sp. A8]
MSEKRALSLYPEHVSFHIDIPNKTVCDVLHERAGEFGSQPALTFYDKMITYAELAAAVNRFASSLQARGVQKGDRVAIMLPNCPQYVIAYYGILQAGAIVTQVNPMLVERELAYLLKDSGAKMIVIYEPLYPRLAAVRGETAVEQAVTVSLGAPPSVALAEGDVTFDEFLAAGSGAVRPVPIEPAHDIAVLQYTGGTTGRSKGAMLTHRNIFANVLQCAEFFKGTFEFGKERYLTVIPLFHVFAMTSGMNLAIYQGAENILLPRFELKEVLETIRDKQPTVFPGVPTMYVAITNTPGVEQYGISSIKTCNSGSAPMPLELMRDFEAKTGAVVLEGYGLSEASPVTHCNPPFAARKPGTVGIGMPLTEYKVVDVATGTQELPPGEVGELIIRGPQVMKGYWNMPEETAAALRDGWLYTGDLASIDEEGYVTIVDRKKDLIIAGGYNIYPREIEEVLYEHPAVREAAAVGVPDPYRGETVKAIIVLKDGMQANEEEILAHCRKNLAAYKVPRIVEFRAELPKTNVGKILRRALREEASRTQ